MDKIVYSEKDELVFEQLSKQGALGKRALFIFQYLFIRREFKELVKEVRKNLGIPEDGFNPYDKKDIKVFLNKYILNYDFNGEIILQKKIDLDPERIGVNEIINKFIEQCGILSYAPNMYLADGFIKAIIDEYILFNIFVGLYKGSFALASIASYEQNTTGTEDQQEPIELRIEIPISVKKDELKDYINQTWEAVEFARKNKLNKKDFVRFRPRNNFIRDLKIFNKYIELEKLSKKQRKEKDIEYIEIGVKRDLEKEGLKDIPDLGTIRSIVSRLRNEIKDKNTFWKEIEEFEEEKLEIDNKKETNRDEF